jgi:hypothetical protein
MNVTGFMDRLEEAVIDNSYGRVSLSWDVDVQPTLYIPYDYPADTPFAYHQNPTSEYLSKQGINPDTDYHSVIVSATQTLPVPSSACGVHLVTCVHE